MKKECNFMKMFDIQLEIDCTPEKCPFGCSKAKKKPENDSCKLKHVIARV